MKRLLLLLALVSVANAAEWVPPSARMPAAGTWQAAGVDGGIPLSRSTIHTTITTTGDTTDRVGEINAAIAACPNNQVVVLGPGTFTCSSSPFMPSNTGKGITVRGSVDGSGNPTTIIDARGGAGIAIGGSYNVNIPDPPATLTMATLTKGATTIQVSSTAEFAVNDSLWLSMLSDPTYPIFDVYRNDEHHQGQWVRVTGILSSPPRLQIAAPGLHGDYTTAPSARIAKAPYNIENSGFENIIIDGALSSIMQTGVVFNNSYNCWVYNCKFFHWINYGINLQSAFRCEIRRCWSGEIPHDVHTTAGHFLSFSSQCLFIDNIVEKNQWGVIQQGPVSGNVWAYNFWVTDITIPGVTDHDCSVNINHGPWVQYNLMEGNLMHTYLDDGYYGGSGFNTVYRNWMFGKDLSTEAGGGSFVLERCVRYTNMWGNVLGKSNIGSSYSTGNPNIGNGHSLVPGTSKRAAQSTLTTRTSTSVGSITAPSGHGVTTGSTIDLVWSEEIDTYNVAKTRRGVTVGTVAGTTIPISGGGGSDLPPAGSVIFVPTTNAALHKPWIDWDVANNRAKTWNATLDTRSSAGCNPPGRFCKGTATIAPADLADFTLCLNDAWQPGAGQRGLMAPYFGSLVITDLTAGVITFQEYSADLPVPPVPLQLVPSNFGFQELDLDSLLTTSMLSNYHASPSGGAIPSVESIGSDTLPNSFIYTSAPAFFTSAGIAWPPVNPTSPIETYDILPASVRYVEALGPLIAPSNTTPPSITGTTTEGQTLTAQVGEWIGNPPPNYLRQWLRCNSAGAACSNIPSATAATYLLTASEIGGTLCVDITGVNTECGGAGEDPCQTVRSAQTAVIVDDFVDDGTWSDSTNPLLTATNHQASSGANNTTKVTALVTGSCTKLRIYDGAPGTLGLGIKLGLYDTAGVLKSAGVDIAGGAGPGWIVVNIPPTDVNAGEVYRVGWIAWLDNAYDFRYGSGPAVSTQWNFSANYTTGLPNPFVPVGSSSDVHAVGMSIVATSPTPTPTPTPSGATLYLLNH